MSSTASPELNVHPIVITDRSLAPYRHTIDVDLGGVTQYLRESGITDKDIMETTIHIKSEFQPRTEVARHGKYDEKNGVLEIYPNYLFSTANTPATEPQQKHINKSLSETLACKLEHRIDALHPEQIDAKTFLQRHRTFVGRMGATALAMGSAFAAEMHTPSLPDFATYGVIGGLALFAAGNMAKVAGECEQESIAYKQHIRDRVKHKNPDLPTLISVK